MAKVYGIHMLELKPGVSAEEFERLVTEEVYPAMQAAGFQYSVLKGDRGARTGKYTMLLEFDSVAERNQMFPTPDQPEAEVVQRWTEAMGRAVEKFESLAS